MTRSQHTNVCQPPGRFLRYAIYGFNDGLVSNLALVAGLSGALVSGNIIILAGLVVMLGAAISMGLGAYISSKSQNEYYTQEIHKEKAHVYTSPRVGKQELRALYYKKGFRGKKLDTIINTITAHKKTWLQELTQGELGLGREIFDDPVKGGIVTFFAFIIGAVVPLVPFGFMEVTNAFTISLFFSILILFIVGSSKTYYTKHNWIYSGLEMVIVGVICAAATYYFGSLISTHIPQLS